MAVVAVLDPSLASARRELEEIDRAIVLLIAARVDAACSAIRIRTRTDGSLEDPAQEALVIARAREWAGQAGISPAAVEAAFRAIVMAGKERFTTIGSVPGTPSSSERTTRASRPRGRSRLRPSLAHSAHPVPTPT